MIQVRIVANVWEQSADHIDVYRHMLTIQRTGDEGDSPLPPFCDLLISGSELLSAGGKTLDDLHDGFGAVLVLDGAERYRDALVEGNELPLSLQCLNWARARDEAADAQPIARGATVLSFDLAT